MNIILENYLLIIMVGLFFVFALIGYLIDMLRNSKNDVSQNMQENIIPNLDTKDNVQEVNDVDDLLKTYDETND